MSPAVMYSLDLRRWRRIFLWQRWIERHFRNPVEESQGLVFTRLFEQRHEALNFRDGIFVGFFGTGGILKHGVDQDGESLGDSIEDQQLVGDQKIKDGRLQFILRDSRHNGFDIVDEFVANKANRATGEAGQTRHIYRAILIHDPFHDFQAIAQDFWAGVRSLAIGCSRRGNLKRLYYLAIFQDLNLTSCLPNDRAGIATNKRVSSEMFAAFDRFEQERFTRPADFAIGRKRRFNIRNQTPGYRDQIALCGQRFKFVQIGEYIKMGRKW